MKAYDVTEWVNERAELLAQRDALLAACEAAYFEFTCLEPRMSGQFAKNAAALREQLRDAIEKAKP